MNLPFFGKIFLTLALLSGVVYLGQQTALQTREHLMLTQATDEKNSHERKLEFLQKAFAIEPKNFQTAYDIGESFRARSLSGNRGYEEQTQEAMKWFKRSIDLNPFYPDSYLRYGMCLDWREKTAEAADYFQRAAKLDPNGYYTVAYQGWYRLQLGDLAGAKQQFERSQSLMNNPIAESYLEIIEQKMVELEGSKN